MVRVSGGSFQTPPKQTAPGIEGHQWREIIASAMNREPGVEHAFPFRAKPHLNDEAMVVPSSRSKPYRLDIKGL
jgi:hypothetical protein